MVSDENCLTVSEQEKLQEILYKQRLSLGRTLYFENALAELFPGADCYYYKPKKEFLLYVPYLKNEYNEQRMRYLFYWFLDVTAKLKIYWQYPFGIMGKEKTMHIGNMRLYGTGKEF